MSEPGDELQPEIDVPLVDMSRWDDGMFERAVALMVYDAEIEDDEAHEVAPDYDW